MISAAINKYCYVTVRRLPPLFPYKNQLTYSQIERFNEPDQVRHPACSGIGSSSAFAVGLLKRLHAMRNEFPDKMTLAKEAIFVERELCAEAGGVQDQLAASFGGLNRFTFSGAGISVEPIRLSNEAKEYLFGNLLLLFTGFTRFGADVSAQQQKSIPHSLHYLDEMKQLTERAGELLRQNDIDGFGRLLNEEWNCKRKLSYRTCNNM